MYPLGGAPIPAVDTTPPPVMSFYVPHPSLPFYAVPVGSVPPSSSILPIQSPTGSVAYPVMYPVYPYPAQMLTSINGMATPVSVVPVQSYAPSFQVQQGIPASSTSSTAPSVPTNGGERTENDSTTPLSLAIEKSSLDLLSDDCLNTLERCKNCGHYFHFAENKNNACIFHPGTCATPESVTSIMMPLGNLQRWTCCKGDKSSPGCKTGPHVVDRKTSAILKKFESPKVKRAVVPTSLEGDLIDLDFEAKKDENKQQQQSLYPKLDDEEVGEARSGGLKRTQMLGLKEAVLSPSGVQESSSSQADSNVVRHLVAKTDTLSGLSVRYGVKVDDIKRANNIIGDSIFERKFVDIPNPTRIPSEEELSSRPIPKCGKDSTAISRFVLLAKCTPVEAKFYLTDHDWNFKEAMAAYKQDLEWEKKNPPRPFSKSIKSK